MKVGFSPKILFLYLVGFFISTGLSFISYTNQNEGMKNTREYLDFNYQQDIWSDVYQIHQRKMNALLLSGIKKDSNWKKAFEDGVIKTISLLDQLPQGRKLEILEANESQMNALNKNGKNEKEEKDLVLKALKRENIQLKKVKISLAKEAKSRNENLFIQLKGWLSLLTYYSLGMTAIFTLFLYFYHLNKKSYGELEKERKKRDFMLNSLESAVLLLDKNFSILSSNEKARQLWKGLGDPKGLALSDCIPSFKKENERGEIEEVQFLDSQLFELLKGGSLESGLLYQLSFSTAHLQPQWFQLEAKSFKDEIYLINFQNITNLYEASQLIKRQQSSLIEQSKMTALGQMSSGMAHEINNPLAIISSEAEELLEIAEDEGQVSHQDAQNISENIQKTTHRIAKIIKGLRIFARQEDKSEQHYCHFYELVEEVLTMAEEKFKTSGVKFDIQIPNLQDCQNEVIFANEVQIIQVLVNLLNNAFDATKEQRDRSILFSWKLLPDSHLITVKDNGPGIDEKNKAKIFDPFFTTKKVGEGTGLGLSLSKSIMEDHKGSLELGHFSEGAEFIIKIPRVVKEEEKWTA